ncbi:DUF6894 family protein [Bradyrhizobium sp. RDM4]|uniref:DUF6894 family protein n=1 Tax=Bradyrhizobium sp. RDM4 TaxID=3378765 RepID=UPI0038FD1F01
MPRFFFDFSSGGTVVADDVGTEFPSLEEAYLDACQSALEISFEKLRIRNDPNLDSVEILDARRQPLMQVPFSDVLRPKPLRSLARHDQCTGIVSSYQQQLTRGKRLKAEIREELRKMQTTFGAIRANLERLK